MRNFQKQKLKSCLMKLEEYHKFLLDSVRADKDD